ncbi:magnesium transporter [Rhodobium gokarnense]|uniref:Magnesium transporter MgtE n=1 Tax=Rhodobium gokarnense TaxID=364296 RepID=A0ABT3H9Z1_9HYPH|nr:magnesium transporter [Rhodobium gokarnense]MCW2307217.1 magnesium transporter [Rhodobium gokarnense]
MADTDTVERPQEDAALVPAARDEEGNLSQEFVEFVGAAVEADDADRLKALTEDLHEADLADLIDALHPANQSKLVRLLGRDFDFVALTELDDAVRVRILDELPPEAVAEGMRELDSDDAAHILEDLDEPDKDAILEQMSFVERLQLQRVLEYPEESAGRRMQTDFIAVPPFWTVGQTIDYLREAEELPEEFYQIFVVDPGFRLQGTLPLDALLRSKRPQKISEIMRGSPYLVSATDDQEEVAHLFERYNLISAAVTDDSERLVGVIHIDDIVDVIQEEVDEDIKRMAGIGDEEVSDSILATVKSRFTWLLVNLATAVLASLVIGLFDATIQQMVALAVLMPIVASMGGNAGTQTMTVAVRALATRDIDIFNARRIISREAIVGFLNGVLFAVVIGVIAAVWFDNVGLGGVIAAAMVVNMVAAGLFGILIPLTLNKLRVDPAIASGVFVTTVTDVVGFFAFLSFAAWWFGLA